MISFGAIYFLPPILAGIPDLKITPDLLRAIPLETGAIGVVMLIAGYLLYSRKERIALGVLVGLMVSLAVFNVSEFANFDAITSSKKWSPNWRRLLATIVSGFLKAQTKSAPAPVLRFYIRQNTTHKDAKVLIMNVDAKRPAPIYPGAPLIFFIDQKQLDDLWSKDVPTLYVTDFKRTDWEADKPHLPSKDLTDLQLKAEISGHRRVYANLAAWNRLKTHFPQPK